ncbi:hypothetical protein [Fusibacter bizertensis]
MMKHFDIISALFLLSLVIIFEVYWRWNDKKKIHAYIKRIGGEVTYITKLSFREHIYAVEYHLDHVKHSKTVKFSFTQDEFWY